MSDRIALWPIYPRPDLAAKLPSDLREVHAEVFLMKHCRIIVANEPQGWHLSISCADRDPTWEEIATARYRLLPDIPEMAMFLPPLAEYVNLHPFTFHLHEVKR
jgi:hypothetical protein